MQKEAPMPFAAQPDHANIVNPDNGEGDIAVLLSRLWVRAVEQRFLIFGLFALAILAAIAITMLQTPLYKSTAQIEISRIDNASAANAVQGEDLPGVETRDVQYYNTQYSLLGSRAAALDVVDALDLGQNQDFLDAFDISSAQIAEQQAAAILLSNVEIEPVMGSNLVDITFSSPDAGLSAAIANTWAEEFLRANFQKRFGDTILARQQLEDLLQETRAKLEESETQLNNYANSNEIIVTESIDSAGDSTRRTLLSSQLASISDALAQATIRRISAESSMRSGVPADGDAISGNSAALANAEAALAELRTTFGPQHPLAQAKQAQIQSLRSSIQAETQDALGRSRQARAAAYQSALREERELRNQYEQIKARYLGQQDRGVEYGILERQVSTNREIYDSLLQRYNQLGTVASGTNNMNISEPARAAGSPYFPSLLFNLGIALGVAALLSATVIYLLDQLDHTIRNPEEVKRRFGLRLLGVIPSSKEGIAEALEDRHSVLSEAYASTRTSLQFLTRGTEMKVFMMTSTRPGEGKTSSAFALAKSFVDVGERVALVDMDLRRRGLSKLVGGDRKHANGVASFLSNSKDRAVLRHHELGFDFLPTAATDISPVVLLNGAKLGSLIQQLKSEYDRVIIDGPPVIGLADALELGAEVDGVVFLLQANAGNSRAIERALDRMRDTGANLVGGVLTQVDQRNDVYGYGYEYAYSYRSEDEAVA